MIKRMFEINLTGIELYAVQEIDADTITPKSIAARNTYAEAREYIGNEIETMKKIFGENNVKVVCDKMKDKYTVKASYDNEVAKGDFTIVYAITKLYL